MSDVASLRKATIERAVNGEGFASQADRKAAFDNRDVPEKARALVDKVAKNAWKVTDEDIEAAKKSRLSEDEIFELVVCATLGQATRQLEAGLAAVDKAKP